LEGGGAVGYSKEHYEEFEEATIGMEGCLPLVSGLDSYVVETPLDIELGEVLGSAELGDELGDEGEGVPVLDSYGVVMPDSRLDNKSDIFHYNNENNQLERRVRPPRDVH